MKARIMGRTGLLVFAIGVLPALMILALIRIDAGTLTVMGQELTDYNLPRLTAAIASIVTPLMVLAPVAYHLDEGGPWRRLRVGWVPVGLLLPSMIAGLLVGARDLLPCLVALGFAVVWQICLVLWLAVLGRVMRTQTLLLVYAISWAASAYLDHLRLYVLPYLEGAWLTAIAQLWWLLPQIDSIPHHLDDYLQSGIWAWPAVLPTLIQLVPLTGIAWWQHARAADSATEGD